MSNWVKEKRFFTDMCTSVLISAQCYFLKTDISLFRFLLKSLGTLTVIVLTDIMIFPNKKL